MNKGSATIEIAIIFPMIFIIIFIMIFSCIILYQKTYLQYLANNAVCDKLIGLDNDIEVNTSDKIIYKLLSVTLSQKARLPFVGESKLTATTCAIDNNPVEFIRSIDLLMSIIE